VLVLLTGALDADAALPAGVVLPLPGAAEINAVARIDGQGRMIDDIEYRIGDGHLALTTPDPRFRVEYYAPYRVEGVEHLFDFEWRAEIPVARLDVKVQRPKAASGMLTVPEAVQTATGDNGLFYHVLPGQAVPAGSTYTASVRYAVERAALSVAPRPARSAPAGSPTRSPAGGPPQEAAAGPSFDWGNGLLAGTALLTLAAFAWALVARGRKPEVDAKAPRADRPAARFCHACGTAVRGGDRFCGRCGTSLQRG
jgi:hypothetical protein